jgi:hypothetical protein
MTIKPKADAFRYTIKKLAGFGVATRLNAKLESIAAETQARVTIAIK